MSYCLDVIGTLLIPREVFLLQHRVFREYGKVAVGPDFVHTFPSFMVVAALFVVTQRELNVKYFKISNKTLEKMLQIFVNWIIINAGLWYWLVFQRILYCCIWSYWSHEIEFHHSHVLWWQRVWQSLYPPPASPSPISASFVSWILSMIISGVILHCSLHVQNLTGKCLNAISLLIAQLKIEAKYLPRNRYCGS
ncbi:uncharacterized protein LOC107037363 [Diachasma alloeum]|uniref:uncharacterized protein LOC107037363 n=1 Tax=Diachasma alloeum TaxID=454923 RepID=UPI0007384113|nr:uncharacterized protein LOC107037363 [Diachasma alloeum]